MRIQHNIAAMNAYRNYTGNTSALSKNLEKLSSGYKINRAGDDAAGLAISEKMRAQITGLKTAQANAKSGINLVQTAEGAMTEVHDMLNRMYELAEQSANGTYDDDTDRNNLQKEISQLKSEIDRIADSTNFNGIKLMDGSLGEKAIDAYAKAAGSQNLVDGVTVNAPVDGAGKKDQFSLDFSGTFGAGDSMTLKIATTGADGALTTKDLKLTYDARIGDTATAGKFSGETKLEQMTSIAGALSKDADLAANYDVEVIDKSTGEAAGADSADENITVRLTAKNEGVSQTKLTVTNGENNVSDAQVIVNTSVKTAGKKATTPDDAHATTAGGYDDLFSKNATTAGKLDLTEGDILKFKVNVQGIDMTVTLKVGQKDADGNLVEGTGDFVIGGTNEDTTANLATALQNATFDDIDGTAIDEKQFKVSDYFTVTANKTSAVSDTAGIGSLKIASKAGDGIQASTNIFGDLDVTFAGGATTTISATAPGAATNTSTTLKSDKVSVAGTTKQTAGITGIDFSQLDSKLTGAQVSAIKNLAVTDTLGITGFNLSFTDIELNAGDTIETALTKLQESADKQVATYNANTLAGTSAGGDYKLVDSIHFAANSGDKTKLDVTGQLTEYHSIADDDLGTGAAGDLSTIDFNDDTAALTDSQIAALTGLGGKSFGDSTELSINLGSIGIAKGDTGASALDKIRQAVNDSVTAWNSTKATAGTAAYNRYDYLDVTVDTDDPSKLHVNGNFEKMKLADGGGTGSGTAAAIQQVSSIDVTNTIMKGDTLTIRGQLSDGLDFQVDLIAGQDFEVGANSTETMKNLADALNDGSAKVKVTGTDGKVKEFTSDKIFNENEFKAEADAGRGIILTSMGAGAVGKGVAAGITGAQVTVAEQNKPSNVTVTQDVVGKAQSKAENSITFDPEKIEQGTTMTIDGKTYEFVTSADMLTNENNVAVIVGNLNDRGEDGNLTATAATGEDIAKALIQALHNDTGAAAGVNPATNAFEGKYTTTLTDENGNDSQVTFTLSVDPNSNTLKMVSDASGTGAVALKDIAVSSDKQASSVVTFGTTTTGIGSAAKTSLNVKVGDTITIDGTTYEFTDGVHRTQEEGNVGISLEGVTTANDAAQRLADAVNNNTKAGMADGKAGGVIATVDKQTGSVVLTSKYNDTKAEGHEYDAPEVSIPESGNGLTLQIGDTGDSFNKLTVSIGDMHAAALGIGDVDISTQEGADAAISKIKDAINSVSSTRGTLGATQNRLDHTINNLSVMQENIQDAESSIRDTDVASEMMEYTKNNILIQSAQAMLAQANQLPQGVLQLLQ